MLLCQFCDKYVIYNYLNNPNFCQHNIVELSPNNLIQYFSIRIKSYECSYNIIGNNKSLPYTKIIRISKLSKTTLNRKNKLIKLKPEKQYKPILNVPHFIPPIIENNTLQSINLLLKLKKYIAFQ